METDTPKRERHASAASNGVALTVQRRRRGPDWLTFALRALVVIVLLGVWEFITAAHVASPLLVPTPLKTWRAIWSTLQDGSLLSNVGVTLETGAIGFVIGMVVGVGLGLVIGLSPRLTAVASPFVTIFNALPRIALAPLFILWFGIGQASGVALVISLVIFIALTNTISGTMSVDRNYITIVRLYGAGRREVIQKVVLPSTVPWIAAASRLAMANSLAGAIISEMFLGQTGLGFMINSGSGVFNTGAIFAAIIAALVLAAILDRLGALAERRLLRWRPASS